ncbi:hypothetical protein TI29_14810 [Salmonella enterica]|uniref:Uncharacterized protein n=1 Tax=Salmonella enterica subsp. enterica serovar Agona TaxID=58095 RepID=A0A736M9G3_SALET|nr:hypothetical protein [Salmonella enterica]EAP7336867.1 hypothetical protein [Salmonella enterica subsp. enterica serovar Orion]EBL3748175.1 hypothetical protein [Salmonella enterica subsp. enterica serovar Typhimurium]EBM0737174.1 hypothetical protein [Salmonella enterica subsp. enterica serovar Agona]EBZ9818687.1 hypothetical protein [Salmonella enterica subsp. enterica serovar Senftenberg]ECG9129758.1 hypothetical protein [Salmonella enterica subsp. enterica serovar 4,[5],12:i:-]ECH84342
MLRLVNSDVVDNKWLRKWAQHMTCLAAGNDLSSREVNKFTDSLVNQTTAVELGVVVKELLNHIRMTR